MLFNFSDNLPFARETVWEWHTHPGAVERLTPPFAPMKVSQAAASLSDGTTIFSLPAGLKWIAQHRPRRYSPGKRFTDVCVNFPLSVTGWTHEHNFSDGSPGSTIVTDTVSTRVPLPRSFMKRIFNYRQEQLREDLKRAKEFRDLAGAGAKPLTIAMTGSSGLVGTALRAQLSTLGHTVVQLVRSQPGAGQRLWNPTNPDPSILDGVDAVVHLAGEPIGKPFTDGHVQRLYDSRIVPTQLLARLAERSQQCRTFVSASAVGFYGADRGDEVLGEAAAQGTGILADLVQQWEEASQDCAGSALRVVHIRTGIALSGAGGMLPILAALTWTGLAGPIGKGDNWFSWIALDDLTDIYVRALLDPAIHGPVNATAPHPVSNADFMKALRSVLRRPTPIRIPTWAPAILLGRSGRDELAVASQRVSPMALQTLGHTFRYATVNSALTHELGRNDAHSVDHD